MKIEAATRLLAVSPEEAANSALDSFALKGLFRPSLWVGNCVQYAKALQKQLGGELVEIQQIKPATEYHTVLKYKGRYFDWKDRAGVKRIQDLQFWKHVNAKYPSAAQELKIVYGPGKL